LSNDEAELSEKAADLIRLRGARLDEALPDAVQRQGRLLLDVFDRHKPHVRSRKLRTRVSL